MSESNENISASEVLISVLTENLKQQKKARRWKAVTRGLTVLFIVIIFTSILKSPGNDFSTVDTAKPHTAVIEVKGMISESSFYGSAEHVIEALNKAFKQENVKGIILDLNSPGGSPVQSDLIYKEILKLQAQDKDNKESKKIYAVVSDMCASGCYYIASAADKIYANELSTVGSIGVLYNGFGMSNLMKKVGVDRRLQTAGKYKAFMDPFSEESEEGNKIIQEHLNIVHNIFIDRVKAGRKDKLDLSNKDIFSGLFWTGSKAKELGLVDDFLSKAEVAKEIIQAEDMIDYTTKQSLGDALAGNFSRVSMSGNSLDKISFLQDLFVNTSVNNPVDSYQLR